jgi:RNA polymerase sigma-70 factor (ECF subfamily)
LAARELVERYEPVIRGQVRVRLRDPRLASPFDCADVCQLAMASFFVRAAAGQFDLEQPDELPRLLVVMARRKLARQVRRHRAARREPRVGHSGFLIAILARYFRIDPSGFIDVPVES